jgi:hypothetical protein
MFDVLVSRSPKSLYPCICFYQEGTREMKDDEDELVKSVLLGRPR